MFTLKPFNRNISDEELINDLKRVNLILLEKGQKLTFRSYESYGKVASGTIQTRFDTWNNALKVAGIELNEEKNIDKTNLFKNLENVWIHKGSQPVFRDMVHKPSKYSGHTYSQHFGSWVKSLEDFVDYINNTPDNLENNNIINSPIENNNKNPKIKTKKRTSRNISDRMRFRILMRDGFACQSCGKSPTLERGVELHVDHILPWSKGGETEESNLQTKCKKCNLGKGNAFDK